jgi:glutamyl-tRNA synthetase
MPDGRFAPTPSGDLHLGNLRTALLAWLFARSSGSMARLRIDDLVPDAERPGVADGQIRDLALLGLDWDGPVMHQRDGGRRYIDAIDRLEQAGLTYPCYCTRREIHEAGHAPHGVAPEGAYPGTCRHLTAAERAERERAGRRPALRLRTEGELEVVVDRIHGPVEARVDDLVLRRNDGVPAYNLAVVVDDAVQGIEEVVRADDLLLSTPRQVYLGRRLGLPIPAYAHVPLVLGPGGQRLAKRDGAVTLTDRRQFGESPGQVLSRLAASLGLAGPGESVTTARLLDRFDPQALPTEPWVFDPEAGARGTVHRDGTR